MGKKIKKSEVDSGYVTEAMLKKQSFDLAVHLYLMKESDPSNGRLWAIAATEAEKLYAWISYVCASEDEGEVQ